MDLNELKIAKAELKEAIAKQDWPTIARIIGDPVDPRNDVVPVIGMVADIESPATPDEYLFYFDTDEDTKYVYTLTSGGTVTGVDVTVGAPSAITFTNIVSPVYNIHIVDLNNAKFDVIGKKKKAITRAMDNRETHDVLNLIWEGTPVDNQFDLDSADTYLNFPKLLEMLNAVSAYGDKYILVTGSTVDDDIILTDYNENKNQSVLAMMDRLNIQKIKVTGQYTDASTTNVIWPATQAILVATSTQVGKPVSFGRKSLVPGTVISEEQDAKLRLTSVVPIIPKNAEKPSVGVWGYGEFQAVLKNSSAVARFSRA